MTVSREPLMVPGPDTTKKATGRPEEVVAERLVADPPKETEDGGLKVMDCAAFDTPIPSNTESAAL